MEQDAQTFSDTYIANEKHFSEFEGFYLDLDPTNETLADSTLADTCISIEEDFHDSQHHHRGKNLRIPPAPTSKHYGATSRAREKADAREKSLEAKKAQAKKEFNLKAASPTTEFET